LECEAILIRDLFSRIRITEAEKAEFFKTVRALTRRDILYQFCA
jgi:hypothetical protein